MRLEKNVKSQMLRLQQALCRERSFTAGAQSLQVFSHGAWQSHTDGRSRFEIDVVAAVNTDPQVSVIRGRGEYTMIDSAMEELAFSKSQQDRASGSHHEICCGRYLTRSAADIVHESGKGFVGNRYEKIPLKQSVSACWNWQSRIEKVNTDSTSTKLYSLSWEKKIIVNKSSD